MTATELKRNLKSLSGWAYDKRARTLWTEIQCKDFMAAVGLLNKIARLAERADHHPDLRLTRYRRLKITLTTHSEGGVTMRDIRMAKALGRLSPGREHAL